MNSFLRNVLKWSGEEESARRARLTRSRPALEPLEDRTVPVLIVSQMPPGMVGGLEVTTLSGFVYCDEDNDGIMDEGEDGIGGVNITLARGRRVVGMAVTGVDGFYRFANLGTGQYTITEGTVPPGNNVVGDGIDSLGTIVGPGKKTRGVIQNDRFVGVTLRRGQFGINYNFGERCAPPMAPSPFQPTPGIDIEKFTNGQDVAAPTGPMVAVGSTVRFTYRVRNTGNVPLADVLVVDDNGTPGNPTDDFRPTFTGGDTNGDGRLDLNETWLFEAMAVAVAGQYQNLATVTARSNGTVVNDMDLSHHFGIEFAGIDAWKWNDLDGDGEWDPGEPGLAGWTIELVRDGVVVQNAMTMDDGSYWFSNVLPGTYTLREVPQSSWRQTFPGGTGVYLIELGPGQFLSGPQGIAQAPNFGNQRV